MVEPPPRPALPGQLRLCAAAVVGWLLLSSAAVTAAAPPEPAVSFDTAGGDAWTFHKYIHGRFSPAACDRIVVHTPHAAIEASVDNDRFFAGVPLRSGTTEVSAACVDDGAEVARTEPQRWNVRLPDVPKAWIRARTSAQSIRLDADRTERAPATPAPIVGWRWHARAGNPAPLENASGIELGRQTATQETLELVPPRVDGEYYVELTVTDAFGRSDTSTAVFRVRNGNPEDVDLEHEHPRWVDTAVIYGIAPVFFGDPEFAQVTERLDEIAELGASAIWLSPVMAAPEDDFGYAVLDPFRLRSSFGSEREFRRLVDRAHALGLKVLMDFVPNHLSDRNRYFVDAEQKGEHSPYYDWFERDANGNVLRYFDWTHLKTLDYDNPEVQSYVIAAFAHWLRDYGVDGFRVDASWAVRRRAPEFWPRWRAELKRIDPDLFLLAEASARDPYYVEHGFDAAYDWTDRLGEWAWSDAFDGPRPDLAALRAALTNEGAGFPPDTLVFRFINNNDTGQRFITHYGVAATRVAAALLFTAPGIPLIYNGDEVGAEFEPYDEGPPIAWRDPHGLIPHYRRLTELRRSMPALAGRTLELVATDQDDAVLAYLRPGASADATLLVVLNFAREPRRVRFENPQAVAAVFGEGGATDLLTGRKLELARNEAALEIAETSALILRARATRAAVQHAPLQAQHILQSASPRGRRR